MNQWLAIGIFMLLTVEANASQKLSGSARVSGSTAKTTSYSRAVSTYQYGQSLTIRPGIEFAPTSYMHTPLADDVAIDSNSAVYVSTLIAQRANNFGVANVNVREFTPSIYIVSSTQPTVQVRMWDRTNPTENYFQPLQDKWQEVPLPSTFTVAGGTDQEMVVYQPETGTMWEFWKMKITTSTVFNSTGGLVYQYGARWGGRMDDIARNPGYFQTENAGDWSTLTGYKFGTTATSLPFLAGIITIEEQQAGVINHAIGLAVVDAALFTRWQYPANRSDGTVKKDGAIAEGMMFRFPYDLDLSTFGMKPYGLMIARAVQKYGMFVWDKAGSVSFRAENPGNKYEGEDPYTKDGGISGCVDGIPNDDCYLDDHTYGNGGQLENFPWANLQVIQGQWNQ